MGLILLLSGWWYGVEIRDLGHRDFETRRRATVRLADAGWWAWGALWAGTWDEQAERADRCGMLLDRLPPVTRLLQPAADTAFQSLLESGQPMPPLTPQAWLILESAVCRSARQVEPVTVVTWDGQRSHTLGEKTDYHQWVRRPLFYSDSHPGDVRILAEAVRRKHLSMNKGK